MTAAKNQAPTGSRRARSSSPPFVPVSRWHHRVWLVARLGRGVTQYRSALVYASTPYGAKVRAQLDLPGYTVTEVNGQRVIPSQRHAAAGPPAYRHG